MHITCNCVPKWNEKVTTGQRSGFCQARTRVSFLPTITPKKKKKKKKKKRKKVREIKKFKKREEFCEVKSMYSRNIIVLVSVLKVKRPLEINKVSQCHTVRWNEWIKYEILASCNESVHQSRLLCATKSLC